MCVSSFLLIVLLIVIFSFLVGFDLCLLIWRYLEGITCCSLMFYWFYTRTSCKLQIIMTVDNIIRSPHARTLVVQSTKTSRVLRVTFFLMNFEDCLLQLCHRPKIQSTSFSNILSSGDGWPIPHVHVKLLQPIIVHLQNQKTKNQFGVPPQASSSPSCMCRGWRWSTASLRRRPPQWSPWWASPTWSGAWWSDCSPTCPGSIASSSTTSASSSAGWPSPAFRISPAWCPWSSPPCSSAWPSVRPPCVWFQWSAYSLPHGNDTYSL